MEVQISFNDVDIIDGDYYAASNTHNGLYRFNEDRCELICKFGDEPDVSNLFMQTVLYNDKIIFTPSSANYIYIYDIHKNEMIQIPLIDRAVAIGKFHGVVMWKNFAIFICHSYPALVKLELETYGVEYWEKPIKILYEESNDIMPRLAYGYVAHDTLYAPRMFENVLLVVDLKTGDSKIRTIDNIGQSVWGYFIDDDIEYILSSDGFFIIQNDNILFNKKVKKLDRERYLYSTSKSDKEIYFIPYKSYYSAIPFKVSQYVDLITPIVGKSIISDSKCMFGCVKQINNRLYMLSSRNGTFIEYRIEEDVTIRYKSSIKMDIAVESDMYKLSDWITVL